MRGSLGDPKVGGEPDDVIWEGDWLVIRAMARTNGRKPALDWFTNLDKHGKAKLFAAARLIEHSVRSGRPPGQRATKVETSSQGLWELRITPPGGGAPHLRLLFKREGQTLWAASGFSKQKNHLDRQDVRTGDEIAKEWEQT